MTNQVKIVPELRFPEFDGEWEEKILSQLLEIKSGKVYKETEYTKEGIQLVQGESIDHHKIKNIKTFLPDEYLNNTKNVVLEEGDIVLALNRPIIKNRLKIAKIPKQVAPSILYQRAGKIIYEKSKPDFYLNLFEKHIKDFVMKESVGSDQPFISTTQLKRKKIFVPRTEMEITKLNNFFSKLDRQIELEEQKLAKLEEQKKGYMQKLFSQELRFKTKDNVYYSEWQLHKLGEIFKYSQGKQISVDKQFSVKSNEMKRFIRIVDITENPEPRFVLYESDTGLVNKEDLFMIRYGRPGIVSIGFEGIIANNLFKLIPKIKISTVYFYYLLSYNYYRINLLTNQSTMPALNFKSLDSLKFKIPSYKEQNKIGNFFTKFDELIEKQNKKIDGLKERKKGLLQKMFV